MSSDKLAQALRRIKSNLMHQRRFGVDDMGHWRRAAAQAEGDLEEALAAHEAEKQAGPVAGQASAPAPEHVPVSPEREAAIDAASGLVLLPPIRVTAEVYAELKAASEASGLIVQAVVRDRISAPCAAVGAETECETWRALCEFLLVANEPMAFLRAWNEGNFDACKREWPEAPAGVYPASVSDVPVQNTAPPSPLAEQDKDDAEMLDWLGTQYVEVRKPMRYGSERTFINGPGSDLEDGPLPWDVRAAIRAARAKKEQQ